MSATLSTVRSAFDLTATGYDRARRQLVPCFDGFYGAAIEALDFPRAAPLDALDLGAGTGLMAGFVAAAFPAARITLIDVAPAMLAKARERLGPVRDRIRTVEADYAQEPLGGPFDAIVSALSIHHLEDPAKRDLFRRVFGALKPGGIFVNADQVAGATPALERRNKDEWAARARVLGVAEEDLAAAIERMKFDRPATVAAQLRWLAEASFANVDCAFKDGMFAVFGGYKPI